MGESPCARLPSQAEGLSSGGHTAAGPAGGGPHTHRARRGTVVGHRSHPRHVRRMRESGTGLPQGAAQVGRGEQRHCIKYIIYRSVMSQVKLYLTRSVKTIHENIELSYQVW